MSMEDRVKALSRLGFRKDDKLDWWFNRNRRKAFSYPAVRDYESTLWKQALDEEIAPDQFVLFFVQEASIEVCKEIAERWQVPANLKLIPRAKPATPVAFGVYVGIDDPKYWAPLTDEQVIERMQSGQAGSPIWERGKGEMEIRKLKRDAHSPPTSPTLHSMPMDFSFVKRRNLRTIAERDWKECCAAHDAKCYKSVLLLVGGLLETVLLSSLLNRISRAKKANAAKGKNSDITKWELGIIIEVAKELKLIGPPIDAFPLPIKQYRNLVHPGAEIREKIGFSEHDADVAFSAFKAVLAYFSTK